MHRCHSLLSWEVDGFFHATTLLSPVISYHSILPPSEVPWRRIWPSGMIWQQSSNFAPILPRLWWLDADWTHSSTILTNATPLALHWTIQDDLHRLHNPIAPLMQPSVTLRTGKRPQSCANNNCSTALPLKHQPIWGDHHHNMREQTMPLGNHARQTIDSSHHGTTNPSTT